MENNKSKRYKNKYKKKIYIYLLKKKRETRKANDALVVLAGTRKESLLESTQNFIKTYVDACPSCEKKTIQKT